MDGSGTAVNKDVLSPWMTQILYLYSLRIVWLFQFGLHAYANTVYYVIHVVTAAQVCAEARN